MIRSGYSQVVLKDLTLSFPKVGFISILGRSGGGKTTLINIIGGLDKADSGKIYYNQSEILDYETFRREKIGIVFQHSNLIPHLNALDNVIVSMSDDKVDKQKIGRKILKDLGLTDCLKKLPQQMSGGQQQRVAIARMIAKNVDIIICDEPTGSLDEDTERNIIDIIKELSKEKLVLFVTHNSALAKKYSDRMINIKNFTVIEEVFDEEVFDSKVESTEEITVNKLYKKSTIWLSLKNLTGRYKHTLKYIFLATIIMLISSMSIVLEGNFFKRYLHEERVDKGLKSEIFDIKSEVKDKRLLSDLALINHVDHAAYLYNKHIKISSLDGSQTVRETAFENVEGNEYYQKILTDGRFPQKNDEVLTSAWGAISLLRDLGIGGDRLYDQYMTGEMTSTYVYHLIDDKLFKICEYGNPRIKIVGLVDDSKVYETKHTLYHVEGFTSLFEWPFAYWQRRVKLYKDDLYCDTHDEIINAVEKSKRFTINEEHKIQTNMVYKKIDSVLALSKATLYTVLILATISFISLLLTSLYERKYEVGLYRTIGYSEKNIMKILGLEMLIIGITSALIVFMLLIVFVLVAYSQFDYVSSFIDMFHSLEIFDIVLTIFAIVVFLVFIVTYGGNKIMLNKSIISNMEQ